MTLLCFGLRLIDWLNVFTCDCLLGLLVLVGGTVLTVRLCCLRCDYGVILVEVDGGLCGLMI